MPLKFIGKDPESDTNNCPAAFVERKRPATFCCRGGP